MQPLALGQQNRLTVTADLPRRHTTRPAMKISPAYRRGSAHPEPRSRLATRGGIRNGLHNSLAKIG